VKIHASADEQAVAQLAATEIAFHLNQAVSEKGHASLALSRVSEPFHLYRALEKRSIPWEVVHLFQVDERVAPDGHPDRNATALSDALLKRLHQVAIVHLMPVNPPDPAGYATTLRAACDGAIDVVHLGLGPDGHTASWPPGCGVDEIEDRDVAMCPEYQGRERMTLTPACVNRARWVMFLVTGESKREPLARLLDDEPTIPAHKVRRDDSTWILADEAALGTPRR
jgi:6-phosphogluconolactonase